MKDILFLVFLIIPFISTSAQQDDSISHKHLMIEAINRGDYNNAINHIDLVDDWSFDNSQEKDWVDIGKAVELVDYIYSTQIDSDQIINLLVYIIEVSQEYLNYYYNRGEYNQALPYLELISSIIPIVYGDSHPDYATALYNLGLLHTEIGEWDKAEQYYLEALSLQETVLGKNHPYYASALDCLGLLYGSMGNYSKSEELLFKALTTSESVFGKNHPDYAASLNSLGVLYRYMDKYSKAESYLLEALSIGKSVFGEEHPHYATSLTNLGDLYCDMGLYSKAESYLLDALTIQKSVLEKNHPDYAKSLSGLGNVYNNMGNYSKAESYYLNALEVLSSTLGENHLAYAASMNALGMLYQDMGLYFKAESCCKTALEIRRVTLGDQNIDYISSLNNLGTLYEEMDNYEDAESCYLEALNKIKIVLGTNNLDYAGYLNNLAVLYENMGDYLKSEELQIEAIQIMESIVGNNHPEYASAVLNLGILHKNMLAYSKAEKELLEALKIRKSYYTSEHIEIAHSLTSLGNLYADMRKNARAKRHYKTALKISKSVLGEEHPAYALCLYNLGTFYGKSGNHKKANDYLLCALKIEQSTGGEMNSGYAKTLYELGVSYERMCLYAEAYPYVESSATIYKKKYFAAIDFMTEKQRELYWTRIKYAYDSYPTLVYHYHFTKPSISTFAYNNELFIKGLLLTSSESVKRSILESNDTTLINQWNDLTTKKQQIQVLQEKDPQSDYLKQIQEEAEQLEKQITRSSAAYRENQAMWQITWDSVQNHLSSNDVAIEYFSAPLSEDSTMYCALLLRHNSEYPELIPLFEEKEISSYLSSTNKNITNKTYDFYANGDTIAQLVWSKILPKVKKGKTIYFAPSGLLHQLAIEYLPYDENSTMSDVYNMVRLSSTREIVLNKQHAEYTTATIYGGIAYDLEEDILLAESENYATENLLASRSIENDTLDRGSVKYLPGTKKEAECINTLLKQNNISAKLYTTAKANEESFKSLSSKHNNIIHIGTHGFTWTDSLAKKQDFFAQCVQLMGQEQHSDTSIDPLNRCGLLFAGANIALQGNSKNLPEGVQDGILTAKEISLMDLRDANLVVLSACETAKGDITSEGVFGLQRAFKMAGVQTIIMSLWKVNDHATQLLMTEFYNNWIGKQQSKRDAFRNAQTTVRTRYEEPEYWAGFIMLD